MKSLPGALVISCLAAGPTLATADAEALWPTLRPGPYAVGFRTLDVTDRSRTVAARTDWQGNERPGDNYRRVRVSIWYPAATDPARPPMPYRAYVEAAGVEVRIDGELLTGLTAYLAHSSFAGADPERLREDVERPTLARLDARPLEGSFPVIVYAPSFSYEAFENSVLFEYLASHGYIVAASRSAGPETREMSLDVPGVYASLGDLRLMLDALHDLGSADLSRIGAAGFSWGGLGAAMLGMQNFNVRAVLALDGSYEHAELPAIETEALFRPRRLRGGYLAVIGDREPKASLVGSALYADVFELRFPDLRHWDFASDMIRLGATDAELPAERRALVDDAYGIITHQARLFFDAYLRDAEENREILLGAAPRAKNAALRIDRITARAALPAPPSPAALAALMAEDMERAIEVLDRARANDPEIELLDWSHIQDVILTSPFEAKLRILELMRAERGVSSIYFNNLGQAWRLEGETEKALGYFRQALELNPESGFAAQAVAELEAEMAAP